MKANFNYDLSEVHRLLNQSKILPAVPEADFSFDERRSLIRKAEELVTQLNAHARQAVEAQSQGLNAATARRLLRKI